MLDLVSAPGMVPPQKTGSQMFHYINRFLDALLLPFMQGTAR